MHIPFILLIRLICPQRQCQSIAGFYDLKGGYNETTKSHLDKPHSSGWPAMRYDGDSARCRPLLLSLMLTSDLPIVQLSYGGRWRRIQIAHIPIIMLILENHPPATCHIRIIKRGIFMREKNFPLRLAPMIILYHGISEQFRSATKKIFFLPAEYGRHR